MRVLKHTIYILFFFIISFFVYAYEHTLCILRESKKYLNERRFEIFANNGWVRVMKCDDIL